MPKLRRVRLRPLLAEGLEIRTLMTGIVGFGINGDSLSDEYASESYNYAKSWDELLSQKQGINFGAQGTYGEPRRTGFAFNWARSGDTTTDLISQGQQTSLAAQVNAGQVSAAVLSIGPNDFAPDQEPYFRIANNLWTVDQVTAYATQVVTNISSAMSTLANSGVDLVVTNIVDYGIAPATQANYNSTQRQNVTTVIQNVNAEIAKLADIYNVPMVDLNGFARQLAGSNFAPKASFSIGGVTISNTAGVSPNHAFVNDGIHPHTIVQTQFANLFLSALHTSYGTDVHLFTEQEAVTAAGLTYSGHDSLNLNYANFITLPKNVVPEIGAIHTAAAIYNEDDLPVAVGDDGTITDSDNLNFNHGTFTASITAGATSNDQLVIVDHGTGSGIGVSGNKLTFDGDVIGTFSGGVGSTPLVVQFNGHARNNMVQALLHNVGFQTISEAPDTTPRTVTFRVTDGDGGTSNVASRTVNVVAVNDAPVLNPSAAPVIPTIDEDQVDSTGISVHDLLGTNLTDIDANPLEGIAVVAANATNGTWQYTLNNGTTWNNLGSPAITAARLLPSTVQARVRFVPSADFNGQVTLSFRGWDRTQGSSGSVIDLTGSFGGTNAFSIDSETATLTINPINDAPVLDNAPNEMLPNVNENSTTHIGAAVATLLSGVVTDPDMAALKGMAIVGVTGTSNGVWQYSQDNGGTWQALGSPKATTARLLPADAQSRVRFVPNVNFNGQATISYRAWDQTQGVAGGLFNVGSNTGDATAFSAALETATVAIAPVNAAPVLNTAPNVTFPAIDEDATNLVGKSVVALLGTAVTDTDAGAKKGMAVTGSTATDSGTWQYTLNGGSLWQPLGSPTATSALLLPSNSQTLLRFIPNADFNGQAKINYRAWDRTAGVAGGTLDVTANSGGTNTCSTDTETATLTINPQNDAPVLDTSTAKTLPTIIEDAPTITGVTTAALLSGIVTDPDSGALKGIAITGVTGAAHGDWQYSFDGTTWKALGNPKTTTARLLAADTNTHIRFVPDLNFNGQVSISYLSWDQTHGVIGNSVDTTGKLGGTNAFSIGQETATQKITPVNDPPVLDTTPSPALPNLSEDPTSNNGALVKFLLGTAVKDPDASAVQGIAIISAGGTNSGTWQFKLTNAGAWQDLGTPATTAARLLASDSQTRVRFVPDLNFNGQVSLTYRAWDQTQGTAGGVFDLTGSKSVSTDSEIATQTVLAVNDAPVLNNSQAIVIPAIVEDAPNVPGVLISSLLTGAVSDVDTAALKGIAVTSTTGAGGAWQFSSDNGSTWQPLGTTSDTAAMLLPADTVTRIRFLPNLNFNGQVSITYRAWDQTQGTAGTPFDTTSNLGGTASLSLATQTARQTITAVNDAPKLATSPAPTFASIAEDNTNSPGTLVTTLLGSTVTDPDAGAVQGIAIFAVSGANSGSWEFSINGGSSWSPLGTPSTTAARLLAADALSRVRFVPNADFNGSVTLTYRAWDQTQGTAGIAFNLTGQIGGSGSCSQDSVIAALTVTPVDDAPVLANINGTMGYAVDSPAIVLATAATLSDVDTTDFGGGQLMVHVSSGASASILLALAGAFSVDANNHVFRGTDLVGTLNAGGGLGLTDLVVTFQPGIPQGVVQQLLRSISFSTDGGSAGQVDVVFTLSDGDGGTSVGQTKTINIR